MRRKIIIKKSDLETLIDQGYTQQGIADKFGISRITVVRNLRLYGLKTKSTVEISLKGE